jgi:hypothetical protein
MSDRVLLLSTPRSGSQWVVQLLDSHPDIAMHREEPLNDERAYAHGDAARAVDEVLSALPPKRVVGCKVHCQQLEARGLGFGELVRFLRIAHIIVLWRRSLPDTLVSLELAQRSGHWYKEETTPSITTVELTPKAFEDFGQRSLRSWQQVADDWPLHITPIFLCYEDLLASRDEAMSGVLRALSLPSQGITLSAHARRQNPGSLRDKVTNFSSLDATLLARWASIDVPALITAACEDKLRGPVPRDLLEFFPFREPPRPAGGFRYPVAEPFIFPASRRYVQEAIDGAQVSSGGRWPRKLADLLARLFKVRDTRGHHAEYDCSQLPPWRAFHIYMHVLQRLRGLSARACWLSAGGGSGRPVRAALQQRLHRAAPGAADGRGGGGP